MPSKKRSALVNGKISDETRENAAALISMSLFNLANKGWKLADPNDLDGLEILKIAQEEKSIDRYALLAQARTVEKHIFSRFSHFVEAYDDEVKRILSEIHLWLQSKVITPLLTTSRSRKNLVKAASKRKQLAKILSKQEITASAPPTGDNDQPSDKKAETKVEAKKTKVKRVSRKLGISKLQRAVRKAKANRLFALEACAKKIQSLYRRHLERKNFLELLQVVLRTQRTWRALRERRQRDIETALSLIREGRGLAKTNLQISRNEMQRLAIASEMWRGRMTRVSFSQWRSVAKRWKSRRLLISNILFRWAYFNLSWAIKCWWFNSRRTFDIRRVGLGREGPSLVLTEYQGACVLPAPSSLFLGSGTRWVPGTLHKPWLTAAARKTADVTGRHHLRDPPVRRRLRRSMTSASGVALGARGATVRAALLADSLGQLSRAGGGDAEAGALVEGRKRREAVAVQQVGREFGRGWRESMGGGERSGLLLGKAARQQVGREFGRGWRESMGGGERSGLLLGKATRQQVGREFGDEREPVGEVGRSILLLGKATRRRVGREFRREGGESNTRVMQGEEVPREYQQLHWYLPPAAQKERWMGSLLKQELRREEKEEELLKDVVEWKNRLDEKRSRKLRHSRSVPGFLIPCLQEPTPKLVR